MIMQKLFKAVFLIPIFSAITIHAEESTSNEKNNTLELTYVFNKASVKNLPQNYTFIIGENKKSNNLSLSWGEQGQISYHRKFNDSIYTFIATFTGVHNGSNTYKKLYDNQRVNIKAGETFGNFDNVLDYLGKTGMNTYFSSRSQFNFFDLDLFVKADLEETKHAKFAIYGGALIGGYNYKNTQKGYSYGDQRLYLVSFNGSSTDYFLGPNAKIFVNAPFLNNHLQLSLRLGAGFMMGYYSLTENKYVDYEVPAIINYKSSNQFRFSYQFDILAQVAFCYRSFSLASGITQFYYQTPQNNNLITFGGPFIKAGLDF